MKTNLKEIKSAFEALQQMKFEGLIPYKELRKINRLKNALSDEMNSAADVQIQIMEEHNGHVDGSSIKFDNQQDFLDYSAEWEKVSTEEFQLDCEAANLSQNAEKISFESLVDTTALEKFIDFGDD